MNEQERSTPITTYISIVVGILMIAYVAIDRSSNSFTFLTLIGYVLASLFGLLMFWVVAWIAVRPLGHLTKLGSDNPSFFWTAVSFITSAFTGAIGFFIVLSLLGL